MWGAGEAGGRGGGRKEGRTGWAGREVPAHGKTISNNSVGLGKVDFRVSGGATGTWPNSIPERLNAQVPNSSGQETRLQTRVEMVQVGGAQRPGHFGRATLDTFVSQILFGTSRWSCSPRRSLWCQPNFLFSALGQEGLPGSASKRKSHSLPVTHSSFYYLFWFSSVTELCSLPRLPGTPKRHCLSLLLVPTTGIPWSSKLFYPPQSRSFSLCEREQSYPVEGGALSLAANPLPREEGKDSWWLRRTWSRVCSSSLSVCLAGASHRQARKLLMLSAMLRTAFHVQRERERMLWYSAADEMTAETDNRV